MNNPIRAPAKPEHAMGAGTVDHAGRALGLLGDPGDDYRVLPPTRWRQPWSGTTRSVWLAVGAALVGFLLVIGVTAGRDAARVQGERKAELVTLIEARMERVDALGARLEELRSQVAGAEARTAAGLPVLRARLADAEAKAGLTAVQGPGVRVTLSDAAEPCRDGLPENCRIQDADLQMAVNTLFGIGAEAVSVNGERIISTSAIRSAGRAILLNYRVLQGPYVIDAIGDPNALKERLAETTFAADFALWRDTYGLGYAAKSVSDVEVPAFGGRVRLRTAAPGDETE
jgi:uncharacterized protein YlxW (UPF0749 family)